MPPSHIPYRRPPPIHVIQTALIAALHQESHNIDANRTTQTTTMKFKQKRQLTLKLEQDRVEAFKGDLVTSSVIHGYEVQYYFQDFMEKVMEEYQKCQNAVATSKLDIMNGEKRKHRIKFELEKAEV